MCLCCCFECDDSENKNKNKPKKNGKKEKTIEKDGAATNQQRHHQKTKLQKQQKISTDGNKGVK